MTDTGTPPTSSATGRHRSVIDDSKPPPTSRGGRRRFVVLALLLVVFIAFGGVVWIAYLDEASFGPEGEPPLILAETGPVKVPPSDPGISVPHRTSSVHQLFGTEQQQAGDVERLLPPPEEPRPLPEEEAGVEAEVDVADAEDALPEAPPTPVTAPPPAPIVIERLDVAAVEPPAAESEQVASTDVPADKPDIEEPGDAAGAIEETALAPPPGSVVIPPTASRPSSDTVPVPALPITAPAPAATPAPAPAAAAPTAPPAAAPDTVASADTPEGAAPAATPPPSAPAPAPEPVTPAEPVVALTSPAAETAPAQPAAQPVAGPSFRIQLVAVNTSEAAERAWLGYRDQFAAVLAPLQPFYEVVETAAGTFHRVQAGPFVGRSEATVACDGVKAVGGDCFVAGPFP